MGYRLPRKQRIWYLSDLDYTNNVLSTMPRRPGLHKVSSKQLDKKAQAVNMFIQETCISLETGIFPSRGLLSNYYGI